MTQPLLSIVVPTKDRNQYVCPLIEYVLGLNDPDLELVIQDNSRSGPTPEFVELSRTDSRFRYQHVPEELSATENFNQGAALAAGDYVCFIGDDDGVAADVTRVVRWAAQQNIDALSPVTAVNYCWPDFRSKYQGSAPAAKLNIDQFDGSFTFPDARSELATCLGNAAQGMAGLPKVYHGIVRRDLLEAVKQRSGAYFHGVSPDMSGALSVGLLTRKFCAIRYPIVFPGSSGGSNAGRSAMRSHKGSLRDDPYMRPFRNLVWPPFVPEFFSVQTVWASTAVQTLQHLGEAKWLQQLNLPKLHALCLIYHRDWIRVVLHSYDQAIRQMGVTRGQGYAQLTAAMLKEAGAFGKTAIKARTNRRQSSTTAIDGLQTIKEAASALDRYLQQHPAVLPSERG